MQCISIWATDKLAFVKGEEGEEMGEGEKLVTDLQEVQKTMAERLEEGPGLQLFSSSDALKKVNEEEDSETEGGLLSDLDSDDDEEETEHINTGRKSMRKARVYGKSLKEDTEFDDELSEVDEEDFDDESEPKMIEVDFHKNGNKYREDELEFVEDSSLSSDEEEDYIATAARLKGSAKRNWDINKLASILDQH